MRYDSVLDLGDITVESALTLSGRVILSDGKAIPPQTQIFVMPIEAFDASNQELGADGSFRLEGLPRGVLEVLIPVPEYGFSPKNGSYYIADAWNPKGCIAGRLDNDAAISLLLEPLSDLPIVKPPQTDEERKAFAKEREEMAKRAEETRARPLQGAPQD